MKKEFLSTNSFLKYSFQVFHWHWYTDECYNNHEQRTISHANFCSFYAVIKLKCACLSHLLIKRRLVFLPRPTSATLHAYETSSRSVDLIINTHLTQRVCLRGDWNLDYPLLHCFAFLFRVFLNISTLSVLLRGLRGNNILCTIYNGLC